MTTITVDRALLEQAAASLAGYRRELNDQQPCDAEQALRAALAATPSGPAWHDVPTVPGLWLNSVFMKVEDVEQWHIDCQLHLECARWFGPIPPDGDKP